MKLEKDLPLRVPMPEKEAAKQAGARPKVIDNKFAYWYAPANSDALAFEKWWHPEFRDRMVAEGVVEKGDEGAPAEGQTLTDVLKGVKSVISQAYKAPLWITAEIVNISGGNHCYLELSDYDAKGAESAKARGMIWASDRHIIKRFKDMTQLDLKAGLKILFQATIDFNEKFGLGLTIHNIDPKFTLGDMEAKVAAIRKRLIDNNLFALNRSLTEPFCYHKVLVISPQDAAGLGDFKTQADILQQYGMCKFRYISATFSGNDCARSIVEALEQAKRWAPQIDALVIIRGGGDKAGLYALNEYAIAEAVCQFPCPVIVGIGHDRDMTLLDEIACLRCPTPSLAIAHIAGRVIQNAQEAKKNMLLISKMAQGAIEKSRARTERMLSEIREMATSTTQAAKTQCELMLKDTEQQAQGQLQAARHHVKALAQEVYLNNPINVVNRGYAIIREEGGKVLTSKEQAYGKQVTLTFKDGNATATIDQP
ncbi:exodeoxyribonuclease VII large subunit [Pseudomonas luteola]